MNRNSSPDSAFAYVGKINGIDFKLLRHHFLDKVKDGNEQESVDHRLLTACLRMVDQVPVSSEEREKIRTHLMAHANFKLETSDPKQAQKLINQQNGGDYKLGHETINDTEYALEKEPDLVPEGKSDKVETDTVKLQTIKSGIVHQDNEQEVNNPNTDGSKSDSPSPGGNGGSGNPVVTDDNTTVVNSPNGDKMGKASVVEDKKKVARGRKKKYEWSGYSAKIAIDKKNGKIAVSKEVEEPFVVIANVYSNNEKSSGLFIANNEEEMKKLLAAELSVPSPESQNQAGPVLTTDVDGMTKNPNQDKFAKASLLYTTVESLTEEGRKYILKQVGEAIKNKITAKIFKEEIVGSTEYVGLQVGENEDYPTYLMLEVHRNGDKKVMSVKLLNETLYYDAIADFAKFLGGLSKEAWKPELIKSSMDLATAPAKLERCVKNVYSEKVTKFKEKNKREPNAKEKEKLKSSAYAICNSSMGK